MTTKKIGSNEELQTGLLRSLANGIKRKKKGEDSVSNDPAENSEDGKVNIQSSKSIASEINPEIFAAERREKVNKLKELIQSGQYNPKSEDIAAALQQDIVFEILSTPKDAANE